MALTGVISIELILTDAVFFGTIVAELTFVDVQFARRAFPSPVARTFAPIEVVEALPVDTTNLIADIVEGTLIDLDIVELFNLNAIHSRIILQQCLVVKWNVESRSDQNIV